MRMGFPLTRSDRATDSPILSGLSLDNFVLDKKGDQEALETLP